MVYFCFLLHCLGLGKYIVGWEGSVVLSLGNAILHCSVALHSLGGFIFILYIEIIALGSFTCEDLESLIPWFCWQTTRWRFPQIKIAKNFKLQHENQPAPRLCETSEAALCLLILWVKPPHPKILTLFLKSRPPSQNPDPAPSHPGSSPARAAPGAPPAGSERSSSAGCAPGCAGIHRERHFPLHANPGGGFFYISHEKKNKSKLQILLVKGNR